MSLFYRALIFLTFVLALCRFTVPTRPASEFSWALSYEACAHVFVGGLLGAWLVSKQKGYLAMATSLLVIEVTCFLLLH